MTTERFTLTLIAAPDARGRTPVERLRLALKVLGRSFGLRCVRIEPTDNQSAAAIEENPTRPVYTQDSEADAMPVCGPGAGQSLETTKSEDQN